MADVPSLLSLCVKAITHEIIHGDCDLEDVLELPSDILDVLIAGSPPLALENLHLASCNGSAKDGLIPMGIKDGRKRGRYNDFGTTWKILFETRWPEKFKGIMQTDHRTQQDGASKSELMFYGGDWHQMYWGTHLQTCFDEAAERALLPSFDGHISGINLSDSILEHIGYSISVDHNICDYYKLSHHCERFGCYARCLRLQNVFCTQETCDLLRDSKLQSIIFRGVKSKTHVDGVCELLIRNRATLLSILFIYCWLPPKILDQLFYCLYSKEINLHGIRSLSIKSSNMSESKQPSVCPPGLLSFLSSARSLRELAISGCHLGSQFAEMLFDTLLDFCSLSTLEICDNNISGCFSKLRGRLASCSPSSLSVCMSLSSLRVLSLRGNNFGGYDVEDLAWTLVHMPNLHSLDISDNPIGDEGIRSLTPYFVQGLQRKFPLIDIKMESCSLSSKGVIELLEILSTMQEPLNTLSIADNDLGSHVAAPLAKFLGISRVRVLNIGDTGLGPSAFLELEKELPEMLALCDIDISGNRGGLGTANFIAKILWRAPELVRINAASNFMPPESLVVLCAALKQSRGRLEQLDLTGNFSCCCATNLSEIMEFHSHGKPIVVFPSIHTTAAPYDHDP